MQRQEVRGPEEGRTCEGPGKEVLRQVQEVTATVRCRCDGGKPVAINKHKETKMKTNVPKARDAGQHIIYIAGPMRGIAAFNYPKFNETSRILTEDGWGVVNPASIGEMFGTPEQINEDPELLEKVQRAELGALRSCDAIIMLSGWEKSEGAKRELAEAIKNGCSVYLEQQEKQR